MDTINPSIRLHRQPSGIQLGVISREAGIYSLQALNFGPRAHLPALLGH